MSTTVTTTKHTERTINISGAVVQAVDNVEEDPDSDGSFQSVIAANQKKEESHPAGNTMKAAVSTTSIASTSDSSTCGRCRNPVNPTDQALECETCHQMFHTQCENVNKTQFNCISASSKGKGKGKSRVHWYCNTCDIVTNDWMRSMSTLHANQQQLEVRVNKLEEKVDKKADKEDVEEIKNKVEGLEEKINSTQENGPGNPQPSTSTGEGTTMEVIKEMKDQEDRMRNIIFFNIPESNSSDMNDRTKHDKEEVKELTKFCNATIKKDDMIKAIRLGKKPTSNKPRPLLIELNANSEDKKKALFKNLSKLQNAPAKYKSISVQNDLTQKQREQEKLLREEAKKKEEAASGEAKFKVRGPPWDRRIVRTDTKKARDVQEN